MQDPLPDAGGTRGLTWLGATAFGGGSFAAVRDGRRSSRQTGCLDRCQRCL